MEVSNHTYKTEAESLRSQLADLKNVFNTILESSMAGYWDWHIKKNEEYMSPTFKAMFGYQDHEVPNTPDWWQANIHPDDLPKVLYAFNKHVETKGEYPYDNEVRYYHKNGSIVWVYCRGKVIEWDKDGSPIRMVGSHVNITSLKEARERLDMAMDTSNTGVWDWDIVNDNLFWEPQMFRLYGVSPDDFKGAYEAWSSCLHKDDFERSQQELNEALQDIKPFDTTFRVVWPNGETRFIRGKGKVLFDEKRKPIRMMGMNWDVTREHETIAALADSEERFQLAAKGSSAGVWDWQDIVNDQQWWSPKFYDLLGYADNEIEPKVPNFSKLLHPDDVKPTFDLVDKHFTKKSPFEIEYRLMTKSGEYKWFLGSGQAEWNEKGEPVRMVGSIIDINERKTAEEKLKESRKRFQLAVQGSSAGIWDWYDVTGDDEWWSPKFYELLGYDDKEIPANVKQFADLLHPDDVKPTFDLVDKHFNKEADFTIEYRVKCKSGEYKWFLGSGQAEWDENGTPTRMVGSIIDIDEKKKADEIIVQTAELLKQKNEELQEFVFVASHDLQEPVRTIAGFVDFFADNYKDKLDEDGLQCLEYIKGSTERSQELIGDLLSYSRIGSKVMEKKQVDLNEIVKNVQVDLFAKIKERNAKLVVGNNSLPTINGLETELRLLFQNLIGNAIKFGKPDVPPVVTITSHKSENGWQFSIADNGIGFDSKDAEKVFVIFKQLNSRTEYAGTGIGLAQCKRIVELHNGKIWAESEIGKGATFYFTLPG